MWWRKLLDALKVPFKALFENGSLRRFVAFLIGLLATLLVSKFGVELSPEMQLKIVDAIMLLAGLYLGQSGVVAAVDKFKNKPAPPADLEAAAAVLRGGPQP